MIAIIPAAGYATRLGLTAMPKHLLRIGGRHIIDHIVSGIEALPICQVYIVTNNRFYGEFSIWRENFNTRLSIDVLNDGTNNNDEKLGAVGDIWHAVEKCKIDGDFLIIAGDNLHYDETVSGCNLRPLYDRFEFLGRESAVVGLYDVESLEVAKYMNEVTFFEGTQIIKSFVEKPKNPKSTLIVVMMEMYPRRAIRYLEEYMRTTEDHDHMGDFRRWLIGEGMHVYGQNIGGRWFDIGLPSELKAARAFYDTI